MVQEMERRHCKGIDGIHWDEMMIQEGIVVCKQAGGLVGFGNFDIPKELVSNNTDFLQNENDGNFAYDGSSDSELSEGSSSSSS